MTSNAHKPATETDQRPDAYRALDGTIWVNLRKHPGMRGVMDPTVTSEPLWLVSTPPAGTEVRDA
jgi:hypothetical protein